jgi:hypothetical protein
VRYDTGLVPARIIEPTNEHDSLRVLAEVGQQLITAADLAPELRDALDATARPEGAH